MPSWGSQAAGCRRERQGGTAASRHFPVRTIRSLPRPSLAGGSWPSLQVLVLLEGDHVTPESPSAGFLLPHKGPASWRPLSTLACRRGGLFYTVTVRSARGLAASLRGFCSVTLRSLASTAPPRASVEHLAADLSWWGQGWRPSLSAQSETLRPVQVGTSAAT